MNDRFLEGLGARYRAAALSAISTIESHFSPIAIVIAGSIVRGAPHATSDLDIVVLHTQTWRQRFQIWANDVPVEIFLNSVPWIDRALRSDVASARPVMIGMMATGVIVKDTDAVADGLKRQAQHLLEDGPGMVPEQLLQWRYGIATRFEDAEDLQEEDPARAGAMVVDSLLDAIRYSFPASGSWIPREKELLTAFGRQHPQFKEAALQALDGPVADRIRHAKPIVEALTGASSFFTWESARQEFKP